MLDKQVQVTNEKGKVVEEIKHKLVEEERYNVVQTIEFNESWSGKRNKYKVLFKGKFLDETQRSNYLSQN